MTSLEDHLGLREESCEEFVMTTLLKMCPFPLPICERSVDWPDTFSPSVASNGDAPRLLAALQRGRETMINELSNPRPVLASIRGALESYLPNVNLILESLNSQNTVAIKAAMTISWTGSFGGRRVVNSAIIYEVVMCLHSLAIIKYQEGCDLLSYKDHDCVRDAAKLFLSAGSIFSYLEARILPRWTKSKKEASDNPELSSAICASVAHLCVCSAQQCVVFQSLRSGKSTSGVIAKLCSAVVKSCEDSLIALNGGDRESLPCVSSSITEHLSFIKATYGALVFMFQGKAVGKGGQAIGNYREAITLLVQQGSQGGKEKHDPFRPGLPNLKLNPSLSGSITSLGNILAHLKSILDTADADNRVIYFEEVPVVTLPTPVHLANLNSMPYSPKPIGEIVQLSAPPSAKQETHLIEDENPYPTSGSSVFRSDEELARKLQQQYDQE